MVGGAGGVNVRVAAEWGIKVRVRRLRVIYPTHANFGP